MQSSASVTVPYLENELVRDYLVDAKDAHEPRRYMIQLDVNVTQTKDWNALHRAITDHKPKDAKQIVFGYMDKDSLPERKIVEAAVSRLDPQKKGAPPDPDAPVMEIQLIDDYPIPAGVPGREWPQHVCRFHLELPVQERDWEPLREALRSGGRQRAYEILAGNVLAEHLTDSIKLALQAALGVEP